ncbi:MAG: hypothetical protein NZ954_08770 [Thermofilaceae archaeon]|nr:hypothetical protein [Thermofilaceae archaeon]MCX8181393.1 hypothetical protein [Thermofilaceae archaeon]MDW8003252.1 hypothetical protein [Thermofilaceae archaeon]
MDSGGSEAKGFLPGLTWRSLLAMVLAGLIFLPASAYLWLAVGAGASTAATYVTVILFSALARIYGTRLSRQELFIIYSIVGGIGGAMPIFYWQVFRSYFVNNPLSLEFKVGGVPVRDLVPTWMAPPPSSPAHALRTMFHPDWLPAVAVAVVFSGLSLLAEVALGMLVSYLYIEVEPLPFPFAQIDATMINTLDEREHEPLLYFFTSLIGGAVYGSLVFLLPLVLGPAAAVIPYPWMDFTPYTQFFLPGAALGIATDPTSFLYGMILPPSVTFSIMLGSLATWVLGNTLTLTVFKDFSPEWVREYTQGMSIFLIYQRANLRLWLSTFMGVSFGLAIFILIVTRRRIIESFKALSRIKQAGSELGYPPATILLALFFAATTLSVILYYTLVPGIPLWLPPLLSIGLSLVVALVGARVYGELGLTFSPDFVYNMWKAVVYYSPYQGYAGWIFTPVIAGFSTPWYVNATKAAYLTRTRPIDYYKAVMTAFVITTVLGLVFMDFFWRMAPIPSFVYPYVMGLWPFYAISDCLFATRQIIIRADQILLGIGIAVAAGFGGFALAKMGIPVNPIALVGGVYALPPYTIMVFLMSLLSKYVIARAIGKEKWNRIRAVTIAGFLAGVGIIVAAGVAITLLSKAAWIWPW